MILLLFLFGLALGAVIPPDDQRVKLQRGNCPPFWYNFNGRCYKYFSSPMTWADAEFHCVSQRAHLVSIHSLKEQNFVNSLIRNFDPKERPTWIGLTDIYKEGRWIWSDGSRVDFFFWNRGEPNGSGNENCGQTNWESSRRWNDYRCSNLLPFVCALRTHCP
ncbi:galactose-specific lectin nattectin-like [Acanthochromis polyacanthus]|uniref:galactose-specific lectin nattectin-like n=1 Tax=Acanthochromis polyacanthus TaxID=80966 RepID=UPI000B8F32E7|nr:galactose-specific lectin nattectin-like [Acanthochromis polyacanthus]